MKFRLLIVVVAFPFCAKARQTDSVRVFLDSALNIMERRALFAGNLDWKVVRDSTYRLSSGATTYEDAFPAMRFAFNLLNDKHGWLVLGGKQYINPFMRRDNSRISEAVRKVITKPAIRIAQLKQEYAYLSIPFFGGQTASGMNDFAQRLQDSLCRVMSSGTQGIIIDLRLNGGGNLFPMLVGISNVLGNGRFTESVMASGEVDGVLEVKDYSITLLDTIVVRLRKHCGNVEHLPVAVLIGPATGSSGEQVAIILSMRNNTVLIGEPTAGYVTANNGFRLPGAANGIVIAESYTRDRNGKIYKEDVEPEVLVVGGDDFLDMEKDEKIREAIRWFEKRMKR